MTGVEKLEIFIVTDSTSCVLGSAPTMPPCLDAAIIVRTVEMSDQSPWCSAVSRTGEVGTRSLLCSDTSCCDRLLLLAGSRPAVH